MSEVQKVTVPDIGDAKDVTLIEILVAVGDQIAKDESIVTLEGDKATMDVPSPMAGVVKSIECKEGDQVAEGDLLITVTAEAPAKAGDAVKDESSAPKQTAEVTQKTAKATEIPMPDLGGSDAVSVIEVHVKVGQTVAVDEPLITLEGDKASMEVPSPMAGTISALHVAEGDEVKQSQAIGEIVPDAAAAPTEASSDAAEVNQPEGSSAKQPTAVPAASNAKPTSAPAEAAAQPKASAGQANVYAGPSVRRLARELEIDLALLQGSGRKGRITREDLEQYIKTQMRSPGTAVSIAPAPVIDFSQFGPIETLPMNKIKRLTGQHVHRSWATVPHVTQFDEADITEMEAFRQAQKAAAAKQGYKLTPIVFVMKAVVAALKAFPHFNASLNATQDAIVLKQYYHIGVAVDTPNGLVVPVIRDVDQKSLFELSKELVALSEKARTKGLAPSDMAGGCFTISSLGGIGGTAFTPIVNVPEVAILGLSKASMKPVFSDGEFKPRLMMPLSLSYDHRVIDGADGARFSQFLASRLADIRTLLL